MTSALSVPMRYVQGLDRYVTDSAPIITKTLETKKLDEKRNC